MVMLHGFVPRPSGYFDARETLTWPRTIFSAIAFPWPVVVLAVLDSPRARAARS